MAKKQSNRPLTRSEIARILAEAAGITKKQVSLFFQEQAELAYRNARNTFSLPGLGKLKLVDRPARKMIARFGPYAGREIHVPKRRGVQFRVSGAAKIAMLGGLPPGTDRPPPRPKLLPSEESHPDARKRRGDHLPAANQRQKHLLKKRMGESQKRPVQLMAFQCLVA